MKSWTKDEIDYAEGRLFVDRVSYSQLAHELTERRGEKISTSAVKNRIWREFPDRRGMIRDEAVDNRKSRDARIRDAIVGGMSYSEATVKFGLSKKRIRAIAPVGEGSRLDESAGKRPPSAFIHWMGVRLIRKKPPSLKVH